MGNVDSGQVSFAFSQSRPLPSLDVCLRRGQKAHIICTTASYQELAILAQLHAFSKRHLVPAAAMKIT
jgi:hypothetical protein